MSTRIHRTAPWLVVSIIGLGLVAIVVRTDKGGGSPPQARSHASGKAPSHEATIEGDSLGPTVYRVHGLFLTDDEADIGREGLPRAVLQLKVERYEPAAQQEKPSTSYPVLTWKLIEEGYQGVYGLSDSLKLRLGRRAQLTGVVYDRCGEGLYLRREDDSEADCLMPDKPTHIELLDSNRLPLKALPAQ
jgi:hypothetical protein